MWKNRELNQSHPLFRALRNGMLWHCTGVNEFSQISNDKAIKPNDGRVKKWREYACQCLKGVSIFDFSSSSELQIFDHVHKWSQFLGMSKPLTLALGLHRDGLPGRLVPYPENRDITAEKVIGRIVGGPIPFVETCHCGPIPISAIASVVLINANDYNCFRIYAGLDIKTVSEQVKRFSEEIKER